MYFFLKYPRFIAVWLVSIVTEVLIIGYELQVRKIGITAATQSGQPYYPIYELSPYRLACVAGGSFVAFIWTIFPYPLSDRSWLRKDLGSTLYLLANYYSVVHSTINARLHDTEGDMELKDSPGRRLEKVRYKIFGKLLLLLPSLQRKHLTLSHLNVYLTNINQSTRIGRNGNSQSEGNSPKKPTRKSPSEQTSTSHSLPISSLPTYPTNQVPTQHNELPLPNLLRHKILVQR
jgi:hypothetical protein